MLGLPLLCRRRHSPISPHNLVPEILVPKNLVHLDLDVVTGVPVTVDIDGARWLEQALQLIETRVEPDEVAVKATPPNIGEGTLLVIVAPDDVIGAVGEEGWVDVDEVDALAGHLPHDVEVIAPDEAVRFELRGAEGDALDDLGWEPYIGVVVAEALVARIPAEGRGDDGHMTEAGGRAEVRFLLWQLLDGRRVRLGEVVGHGRGIVTRNLARVNGCAGTGC